MIVIKGMTNLPLNSVTRQRRNPTNDTRIFSPHSVAGLCVTSGHYWYLFKRLTVLSVRRFYRFEHIDTDSSGKVVAKSDASRGGIAKGEHLNASITNLSRAS